MPRRLLRDHHIVTDEWAYLAEAADDAAALILPLEVWTAEGAAWRARGKRLGVLLAPADKAEALVPQLAQLELIAAQFPGPSEGRGYSQARLLRERYGFKGEMRAVGHVRRDQLFFLARCGFNSFELPENELETAESAFETFTAAYQPANDMGLEHKLQPSQR